MEQTELVMVLNDEETYTSLEGCLLVRVLYSEDRDGALSEEQWDEKVEEFAGQGLEVWKDQEGGLICEVVLSF